MRHVPQETELPRQHPNEIPHNEKLLSLKYEVSTRLLPSALPLGMQWVRYMGLVAAQLEGFQRGRSGIKGGKRYRGVGV